MNPQFSDDLPGLYVFGHARTPIGLSGNFMISDFVCYSSLSKLIDGTWIEFQHQLR